MGRKQTEEDEVERLQKEIRELKSINRSLLKRLKKVDKGFKESIQEDFSEEKKVKVFDCPKCGKGNLKTEEMVGRLFINCNVCDYGEIKKKGK